jgi:hypothetical protein
MGEFAPTKQHGDCGEIANPSTAYGWHRRNWIAGHVLQDCDRVHRLNVGQHFEVKRVGTDERSPQPIPIWVIRGCAVGQGLSARTTKWQRARHENRGMVERANLGLGALDGFLNWFP